MKASLPRPGPGPGEPHRLAHGVPTLRIFISSPGDVARERAAAERVVERLQTELAGRVRLEPFLWEHEPLLASDGFQQQMPRPSECDIAVFILWSRLGTRLPKNVTRADGSRYESGTEYEFEDARGAHQKSGRPDILTYRKLAPVQASLDDEEALLERLRQKKALEGFEARWFHSTAGTSLVAALHPFCKPAQFEDLLERHLRKLVTRRLPDEAPAAVPAAARWTGSPFRGLESFQPRHAGVFFGRTRASAEIVDGLRRAADEGRSFALVLGMTGVGKSSVVKAGVLPMLARPGAIEGVGLWCRAVMRPSDVAADLFDALAGALLEEGALPDLMLPGLGRDKLAERLRRAPRKALRSLERGLALASARLEPSSLTAVRPRARLVVVVDQLDEIFTLDRVSAAERERFVDLLDFLTTRGPKVWVIATMRSDFYPRCAELQGLMALKESGFQYDLRPPDENEIAQMIRLPVSAAGLRFDDDPATGENLGDVLRDAAVGHPQALPLLQFTLAELYKERSPEGVLTFDAYRRLGGLEGALAGRAEKVFGGLAPEVQATLPAALVELVRLRGDGGPGRDTASCRWAPLSQLARRHDTLALVEALIEARLVVSRLGEDGTTVVRFAHEALIHEWGRARAWLDENLVLLATRRRVARAARAWIEGARANELLIPDGSFLDQAEELLRREDLGLELDEKSFVAVSLTHARKMSSLQRAMRLRGAGLDDAMLPLLHGAMVTRDDLRAREDADPAQSLLDLSEVLRGRGSYETALEFGREAVELRRARHGAEHPKVAEALGQLALILHTKGDLDEAESLARRALDLRRRLLGGLHPDLAESLNNLAGVLQDRGDYGEAEKLYREALAINETLLGADHPEVAVNLGNLSGLLSVRGEHREAERQLRRALAIQERQLGSEHPRVGVGLNNLAGILESRGALGEAEACARRALETFESALGLDHPLVGTGHTTLARVLHTAGEDEGAESHCRHGLVVKRRHLGPENPTLGVSRCLLADILAARGEAEEALREVTAAREVLRAALPKGHWRIAAADSLLGHCLASDGQRARAEPLLTASYSRLRAARGANAPCTRAALGRLVALYEEWGREEEAARYRAARDATPA